jgi:hypothetical protein
MSGTPASALGRVRTEPRTHWLALGGAIVVGLAAASVHWIGLVLAGALVGLVTRSLRRALLAGLGFGVLAVLIWMGSLALAGSLGKVLDTGLFAGLAIGVGIVAPTFGSLVRGVI